MTDFKEALDSVVSETFDWDGSPMTDGSETRTTIRCGQVRSIAAYVSNLEAERDQYKDDYFRRHEDAVNHLERAIVAELALREMEKRCAALEKELRDR